MHALGIGIVGAGTHGLRYVRHLAKDVEGAALVALCRRTRDEGEALAAAHGCAFYADWHGLIEDPRVEAVVTAVPPALNAAIAEAACRAGKHLPLGKPLAASPADARRIARAACESGAPGLVAPTR